MGHIDWLSSGPREAASAGGKAASLSRLVQGGFGVPMGFVINVEAFRRFRSDAGLDEVAEVSLGPDALGDRDALRVTAARLQAAVVGAAMPVELRAEILGAYAELAQRCGPAVAVRSSATSEDGSASSFAGLFDTYLNIVGPGAVIEAVQRCYASMWSERVLGYHVRRGREAGGAMAVLVMRMVQAETSGVVFTAHPVTGALDQVVINATWGLGDAIVSGAVTPDSYVFAKETFDLLEHETSTKEMAVIAKTVGSGVAETELDATRANAASLDEETAREVARVACQVESYFGSPQDIEFACSEGRLYILQSRPITTL